MIANAKAIFFILEKSNFKFLRRTKKYLHISFLGCLLMDINNSSEFFLSTHKDGKMKKRNLFHNIFSYIGVSIVLFVAAFLFYFQFSDLNLLKDLEFLGYLHYLFIILGIMLVFLALIAIRKEIAIKIDDYGVFFKHGNKDFSAGWSDVIEVKSWRTIHPTSGYKTIGFRSIEQIIIKTQNWKAGLKLGDFTKGELKSLFADIVLRIKNYDIKIIDELEWLPDSETYKKAVEGGKDFRIRQYKILVKIGLVMMLIGLVILPIAYFLTGSNSIWLGISIALIFLGGMILMAGGLSISEEKKKMKK